VPRFRSGRPAAAVESARYRAAGGGLPTFVVPLLILVAVLGYLAGHTRSKSASSVTARTARSVDVVFQYPLGWAPAAAGPQIAGLTLAHATRVAPRGQVANAGLLVGSLPIGEPGPLPAGFVAQLPRLPQTALVDLVEVQAYRYTQLAPRGFAPTLALFVIPSAEGAWTALACYAPSLSSPYMHECEQTVAAVTVAGQSQTYQLTPEPRYAAEISAAITTLDRVRVSLKRELHPQITAARAEQLARGLAAGFSDAAGALGRLVPGVPVEQAQQALATAIRQARAGYDALAAAAAELSVPAYEAAQGRVSTAEASVDRALENFALLGYIPAQSASSTGRG
jgi:hypothetical protein